MKLAVMALMMTSLLIQPGFSQEAPCPDINCYFERKTREIENYRKQQQDAMESFRSEQLQMQQEQLNEFQRQNDLLETQLEELERQNEIQREQLDEQKLMNQKLLEAEKSGKDRNPSSTSSPTTTQ